MESGKLKIPENIRIEAITFEMLEENTTVETTINIEMENMAAPTPITTAFRCFLTIAVIVTLSPSMVRRKIKGTRT
jgi:hypothetical protein